MKRRDHKYEVALSEEQRFALQQLIASGKAPARQLAHAPMLLKIDSIEFSTSYSYFVSYIYIYHISFLSWCSYGGFQLNQ